MRRPKPSVVKGLMVNTTSTSADPLWRQLSPFFLGPVELYDNHISQNVENGWQYCKVFPEDVNDMNSYWRWAQAGWNDTKAHRFPTLLDGTSCKGKRPAYSLWKGRKLNYIEARKEIYCPLYSEAVQKTDAYRELKRLYDLGHTICLLDHDGWDHIGQGYTLEEVINLPKPKMGHSFVLAGLLEGDNFWDTVTIYI